MEVVDACCQTIQQVASAAGGCHKTAQFKATMDGLFKEMAKEAQEQRAKWESFKEKARAREVARQNLHLSTAEPETLAKAPALETLLKLKTNRAKAHWAKGEGVTPEICFAPGIRIRKNARADVATGASVPAGKQELAPPRTVRKALNSEARSPESKALWTGVGSVSRGTVVAGQALLCFLASRAYRLHGLRRLSPSTHNKTSKHPSSHRFPNNLTFQCPLGEILSPLSSGPPKP